MIRVLIVDDAPVTLGNIERVLAAEEDMISCGNAASGNDALGLVRDTHPDVVLIDMDLQGGEGLRTTQSIGQVPDVAVIVMGLEDDDDTLRQVADAGARDYLVKPFGADELVAAIRHVVEVGVSTNGVTASPDAVTAPVTATPVAPVVAPAPPAPIPAPRAADPVTVSIPPSTPDKRIVAVVAGKGGVGTTVIATNIALLAANEARRRAAIVDLDLQHGDVRRMLRVEHPEGILDVAHASPVADRQALIPRLKDGPASVMALLAPALPAMEAAVSPEFVNNLLLQLRALVDVVVIDLPTNLTPAGLAALRAADHVVLVSSMSDPGVRATQGMLRMLISNGVDTAKIVVTLNRAEANSDLTKPAVEEALGRSIPVQLPYDPILVSTSVNRGAPFVLQKPDSQVARRVRELASLLFPMPSRTDATDEPQARAPEPDEAEGRGRKGKKKGLFGRGKGDR